MNSIRLASAIMRDALAADRRLVFSTVGMRLTAAVLVPMEAVALGGLLDAGTRADLPAALGWAALFGICDAGSSALNHPAGKLELTLREKIDFVVEQRILRLSMAPATLDHLDRAEFHNRVELAHDRSASVGDLFGRVVALIQATVLMAVVLIALANVHWVLMALVVVALATIYLTGRAEAIRVRDADRAVSTLRLTDRLFELATSIGSLKEIKVHTGERLLLGQFERTSAEARAMVDGTETRAVANTVLGWLTFSVAFLAAMAFVVREAFEGRVSAGQVLLVMLLAIRLNEQVQELTGALAGVQRAVLNVARLRWLYNLDSHLPGGCDPSRPGADQALAAPVAPSTGATGDLELHDVTFRYPGTDVDILRGLSLRLARGTTVAVVGENGAGKTTLVKLLCGLYAPTSGSVTVGGVDLDELERSHWQRHVAALFQDFVRFELTARETIGLGEVDRMDHEDLVWSAIDRAGARTTVEDLPQRLQTQLGTQWPGGIDLSLGQWQRVSLARGMMRQHPALLILDEPSASLDTTAERALFERFKLASAVASRTDTITLLVSHRFSTVRMADVIVLLRDGVAAEVGSHHDLMRLGGTYAELFEIQARGYR